MGSGDPGDERCDYLPLIAPNLVESIIGVIGFESSATRTLTSQEPITMDYYIVRGDVDSHDTGSPTGFLESGFQWRTSKELSQFSGVALWQTGMKMQFPYDVQASAKLKSKYCSS